MQMLVFYSISYLITCLLTLLSVAFFTLFERKVIGLFHLRVGPDKVLILGLVQPLLDAFKLLTKQPITPLKSNKLFYRVAPQSALFLGLFVWMLMPSLYSSLSLVYSFFLFFCVSSFIVFSVLLAGWSSNSKYSLIGSLRSIAQSISYEVVFSTLVVLFMLLVGGYCITSFNSLSSPFFILLFPLWLICTLAETHRAPFDFRESESELVSGFNTEYSGAYFAFIFLSEYCVLLFSCMLIVYMFIGYLSVIYLRVVLLCCFSVIVRFLFIWIRVTYCRFRYDILIMSAWKVLLPWVLVVFMALSYFLSVLL